LPDHSHPAVRSAPEIVEARKREVAERLGALLQHYGVSLDDEDHWYKLALRLAIEHVPGFQVEKRGYGKDWGFRQEEQLYKDVMAFVRRTGTTAHNACRCLATQSRYREIGAKSDKARGETLYSRFEKCRPAFDKIEKMDQEASAAGARSVPARERDPLNNYAPSTGPAADQIIRSMTDNGPDPRIIERLQRVLDTEAEQSGDSICDLGQAIWRRQERDMSMAAIAEEFGISVDEVAEIDLAARRLFKEKADG
jgi:hypothetical protein